MSIVRTKVSIIGKRPILFHRFSTDSIPLEAQEKTGVKGHNPDEWKKSVLRTQDNQLFLEPTYIFGCLRDGGRYIKSGRGTLQAKMASTLDVLDESILIDRFVPPDRELTEDKTQPVYLDVRSVRNPATKGRNVRYRIAASAGWKTSFTIAWENTVISRGEMEAVVKSSGSLVGLGDGRSIGFGRFDVEKFEIEESGKLR